MLELRRCRTTPKKLSIFFGSLFVVYFFRYYWWLKCKRAQKSCCLGALFCFDQCASGTGGAGQHTIEEKWENFQFFCYFAQFKSTRLCLVSSDIGLLALILNMRYVFFFNISFLYLTSFTSSSSSYTRIVAHGWWDEPVWVVGTDCRSVGLDAVCDQKEVSWPTLNMLPSSPFKLSPLCARAARCWTATKFLACSRKVSTEHFTKFGHIALRLHFIYIYFSCFFFLSFPSTSHSTPARTVFSSFPLNYPNETPSNFIFHLTSSLSVV